VAYKNTLAGARVAIVGAGLVGSTLGIHLGRRGAQVDIFEKRPDLRCSNIPGGRTIVMSLSDRGWRGLEKVGVAAALRPRTVPKIARCVHTPDGGTCLQSYGADGDAIWTVDRKELNCRLMDAAPDNVRFHFQHICADVDPDVPALVVRDRVGGAERRDNYDHVVGADGLFSDVRDALCRRGLLACDILTMDYGYRELSLPAGADGDWILPGDYVHVWPTRDLVLVALPNRDRTFTCSLFYAKNTSHPFADAVDRAAVSAAFAERFPEAAALIGDVAAELNRSKPSDICAVRCDRWHHRNKVLLIGDAAHAIAPFFAMGMNAGLEDCTVLADRLDASGGDLGGTICAFAAVRKPDTDAIGDLSLANFGHIGRSWRAEAHRRWQLERAVWAAAPDVWRPLYAMIAFSHIPLAQVVPIDRNQQRILDELERRLAPEALPTAAQLAAWLPPLLADLPDLGSRAAAAAAGEAS
jgi:kynurenine 3-monooxygenase